MRDMISRRDFLQTATVLGSAGLLEGNFSEIVAKVAGIDPDPDTTYLDAEHVVILMQENRSFDHAYGSLSGVRGFRNPRPFLQNDGTPVWFQPTQDGKYIPPFRLDMGGSNVTWIGGTPHSWRDQVDARNGGRYDNWLVAKRRSDQFPMTMGFFTREDIPFYYALADAFTICDQAFCSSLTGTTPNRLYLWTGTIREDAKSPARVQNGDTDYDSEAAWKTYPERLEDAGVSWRIYQNELSISTGLSGEKESWLSNFTDNPIEWFSQYRVRHLVTRKAHVKTTIADLTKRIAESELKLKDSSLTEKERTDLTASLAKDKQNLVRHEEEMTAFTQESWDELSKYQKSIHAKAFCTNTCDADYRELAQHTYSDGDVERTISVPKGDVLHQFRTDVENGELPAVSWLVPPERFSDHPGSAWFGAWYLSEALNILSQDLEVWKKTIFILCYDENDGFFDHIPPFIAPHPGRPETGKTSKGIDTTEDVSDAHGRDHSIGLGYRCPLLVVSPWSRGGCVNSQVFDHTSVLMLIESWLEGRGTPVKETNISDWRRTVCGDMTSVFRPYGGESYPVPKFLERDSEVSRIHKASFKKRPTPGAVIERPELAGFDVGAFQEKGTRPACPLPYRIEANLAIELGEVVVTMESRGEVGSPFNFYLYGSAFVARAYAVSAGDKIEDRLAAKGDVRARIDGPNGFLREVQSAGSPGFSVNAKVDGKALSLQIKNLGSADIEVEVRDDSYGAKSQKVALRGGQSKSVRLSTEPGKQWYDFVAASGSTSHRFAGKIETGAWGVTDPAMA